MGSDVWNLDYYSSKVRYQPETRIPRGTLDPKYLYGPESVHASPILPLEDSSPDGGLNLRSSTLFSGRRVVSESVPGTLRWHSNIPKPDDFQWTTVYSVSDALREVIEMLDPDVHQFQRLDILGPRKTLIERRWFWQVCQRFDSIDPTASTYAPPPGRFWNPPQEGHTIAFVARRIGNAHFWREALMSGPVLLCTDTAKSRIEARRFTGARFKRLGVAT